MGRILFLTNSAGGLYSFRFELIKVLLDSGHKVYFSAPSFSNNSKGELLKNAGAEHISTNVNKRGIGFLQDMMLYRSYKKIIESINPDVILTYTIKPNIYGTFAASALNKKTIMTVTGTGKGFEVPFLKALVRILYRHACRKAAQVFFQNDSNQTLFLNRGITDKEKSKIVPGSGVNISKFQPAKMSAPENGMIRFLFLGRVIKEKGIEEYLAAASSISRKYSQVKFYVAGELKGKYKKMLLGEEANSVEYIGYLHDVRDARKNAECIVNPSHYEGMSNVLLEAASMGKPLIASNIPGCKEIVEDGKNGYLFEVKSVESLAEKMETFIGLDDETRKKMGEHSRKKVVREFDRDKVVMEYVKCINVLLGNIK